LATGISLIENTLVRFSNTVEPLITDTAEEFKFCPL
jgi:hypothetical protein